MIASTSLEQPQHRIAKPAAEFLRLRHPGGGHHRAGDQPIAHVGIEVARLRAQTMEMQGSTFGCGDDIGRGTRARGLGQFDLLAMHRVQLQLRPMRRAPLDQRRRGNIRRHWRCAARDIRRRAMNGPVRPHDRCTLDRAHRVRSSRHTPAPGRPRCARTGQDDRGSTRTENCPRATAGHMSASDRRCRRTTTARGSSRWCPSPAQSAPGRRRPRRRTRRTNRRSSVPCHADCATRRRGCSRR